MLDLLFSYLRTRSEKMKTPKGCRKVRGFDTVKRRIRECPRYKNMVPFASPIAYHFLATERCPICDREFNTPRKTHCLKDAIDHDHNREHTDVCSYRGRLCLKCNTMEGIAKKSNNHISKWAALTGTRESPCKRYLERPPRFFLSDE